MNFSWWDEAEQLLPTDDSLRSSAVYGLSAWCPACLCPLEHPQSRLNHAHVCLKVRKRLSTHGPRHPREIHPGEKNPFLLPALSPICGQSYSEDINNGDLFAGNWRRALSFQLWGKNLLRKGDVGVRRHPGIRITSCLLTEMGCVCVCVREREREEFSSFAVCKLQLTRKSNVWPRWGKQEAFNRLRDLISILLFSKGR